MLPIRRPVNRAVQAISDSYSSPVGGWNARDPLAMMKPQDAIELWNWFPRTGDVTCRKGATEWSTGYASEVKSLLDYSGADGTLELFACTNSGIYDATAGGAVGAAMITLTQGYCQHINMRVSTTSYLMAVNGVDKMKLYNGATWQSIDSTTTPAITGLATETITNVALHKRRVFFTVKDSLSVWYLPVISIGGAATEFPLDSLFAKGGYLMAVGTWTLDAGQGVDDHFVAITSEGEVVVYKGTDPSDSTKWALVGVFFLGRPLGRQCFIKYGGDLLVITQSGVFPLSKGLLSSTLNLRPALTTRIEQAFNFASSNYGSNRGWCAEIVPKESMILFNIPTREGLESDQYVMNTITGAWAKFTGWNATAMVVVNDQLYFSALVNGAYIVAKGLTGYNDFNTNITLYGKQAYNYFKKRGMKKNWTLLRPIFTVSNQITLGFRIDVDFDSPYYSSGITRVGNNSGLSLWGTAVWGIGRWVGGNVANRQWRAVASKEGYCASLAVLVDVKDIEVSWSSTDFKFIPGNGL